MFLSSPSEPFLCPDLPDTTAPRTEAVKTGRRPPAEPAQRGLDGREHGANLNQVGRADCHHARHAERQLSPTGPDACGVTATLLFHLPQW